MSKIYQQVAFGVACVVAVGAVYAQTAPLDRLREIVRNNVAAAAESHIGKGNEIGPTTASSAGAQAVFIRELNPQPTRAPRAPARTSRASTPAPAARIAPSKVVPVAAPAVAAVPVVAAPMAARVSASSSATSLSAPVQQPMLSVQSFSAPSLPQQTEPASAISSIASPANAGIDSETRVSLSSLLALNTGDIETPAEPLADPTVYLILQQAQGKAFYLVDQQLNEGLLFRALPAEEFERVAGFQLLNVQPDTLVGVSMSPNLHQELMATSSQAIAKADEGVGLVKLPDGVVRIVSSFQSDSDK
ncbi:hypothetical protein [Limnobacter alexandrii]|uniref:hypothetical protein n=1 Tax=Limnobacter alexandrii TaxID=2570352 RepID=UPI00110815C3|nr:hypothetical protein [Limnobacter alexandrii]